MSLINFPILYIPNPTVGRPLFSGQIFVGEPDTDPEVVINQKQLNIMQEDGTIVPVAQPFTLSAGGVPMYNGSTVRLDVDGNYSMKILDRLGGQAYYIENVFEGEPVTVETLPNLLINDLSQTHDFATVAGYKAFTTIFPVGKIIKIIERQAEFTIISGIGTADEKRVIANTTNSQSAELIIVDNELNAINWGGALTGLNDASLTVQPMADYSKEGNYTLVLPDGLYTFHTEIDLSSPGGGAAGFRDMAVVCGHEAKFSALNNTINIFNISGQRRFEWSGGWFKKANKCFSGPTGASPQPSDAYCHFRDITFEGESIGAIQKCYSSTTPIGVYFTDCDFGTDASTDMIDLAIEMLGNDIGQSNLFKATRCTFINCVNAVNMPTSTFARFGTSFTDCRFEQLNGYAINAGTNTRDLHLSNCYFEACGSASVKPIVMAGGKLVFDGGQIAGSQKNTDAFIAASAGVEIETRGKIEYLATGVATVFIDYAAGISQTQFLYGVSIQGNGTQAYKSMLFKTATQADEQYVNWEVPRLSSTLIDTQISRNYNGNQTFKGFISYETEIVNLAAQSTNYDIANINVPSSGGIGLRISAESYQTIQTVGHIGKFEEVLAHWDGAAWVFTSVKEAFTINGFDFIFVGIDINNFKIQANRFVGGATNSPFRALITVRQSSDNMEGNEIVVTS